MLAPSQSHTKSNVGQATHAESKIYRFRCPCCQKLYTAHSAKLKGHRAEFECIKCSKHFAFNLPAGGYGLIPTFTINNEVRRMNADRATAATDGMNATTAGQTSAGAAAPLHGRVECGKCGSTNSTKDAECWKCQVVLDRVKDLPLEMGMKASPAVVALWKQVLSAIERPALHRLFIKECQSRDQLEYAIDRYERLCEAQPQDRELASYLLIAKRLRDESMLKRERSSEASWKKHLPPKPVLLLLPVMLSLIIIMSGLSHPSMRNLVGLGAAALALYLGALALFLMPKRSPEPWLTKVRNK